MDCRRRTRGRLYLIYVLGGLLEGGLEAVRASLVTFVFTLQARIVRYQSSAFSPLSIYFSTGRGPIQPYSLPCVSFELIKLSSCVENHTSGQGMIESMSLSRPLRI